MDSYKCPLTGEIIDGMDCCIIQTAAENFAPKYYLPNKQNIEKEKEICMSCRHHEKFDD